MQFNKPLLAAGLLFGLTTLNAEAALTPYISAGQSLVYSDISKVTWTGDANLLGTMIGNQGYSTVVNAIIAASPVIHDRPNFYDGNDGSYSISAADFSSRSLGRTNWFGAQAFVGYLNNINYGGSTQWRLPTSNAIYGYNGTAGNELGQLFYNELSGTAGGNIPNTANFTNEQTYAYWLGTEYASSPAVAWVFYTGFGHQNYDGKGNQLYAWAVSPGQVSAVPVPGAVWLFGTGLVGLLGLKRRGHAG